MLSLAFLIRHDHYDVIDETHSLSFIYSLFIDSLFSLASVGLSAMTTGNFDSFEKPRQGSLYPFLRGFRFSKTFGIAADNQFLSRKIASLCRKPPQENFSLFSKIESFLHWEHLLVVEFGLFEHDSFWEYLKSLFIFVEYTVKISHCNSRALLLDSKADQKDATYGG